MYKHYAIVISNGEYQIDGVVSDDITMMSFVDDVMTI